MPCRWRRHRRPGVREARSARRRSARRRPPAQARGPWPAWPGAPWPWPARRPWRATSRIPWRRRIPCWWWQPWASCCLCGCGCGCVWTWCVCVRWWWWWLLNLKVNPRPPNGNGPNGETDSAGLHTLNFESHQRATRQLGLPPQPFLAPSQVLCPAGPRGCRGCRPAPPRPLPDATPYVTLLRFVRFPQSFPKNKNKNIFEGTSVPSPVSDGRHRTHGPCTYLYAVSGVTLSVHLCTCSEARKRSSGQWSSGSILLRQPIILPRCTYVLLLENNFVRQQAQVLT